MKKTLLFLSNLLVAGVLFAQSPPNGNEQKPDIATVLQINEDNHDFGKIPQGKPVEFDIIIKNLSHDSVKVDNVKVGCGCTTPKYEQGKAYAPGETFKVTLGFSGNANGPFEKTAEIFFSDGYSKQIRFHGTGYAVPETPAPSNGALQKLKGAGR